MSDKIRVGIVGSAGTGKSSVARLLAERLSIPFLSAKSITGPILERDHFDFSSGIQIERFLGSEDRQREILQNTIRQHQESVSFVTDRTSVDLTAYAICEQNDINQEIVSEIHDKCQECSSIYTHLFVCPWIANRPLGNNSRRTLNPWYQFIIHSLAISVMGQWGLGWKVLTAEGAENRVDEIMDSLGM